MNTHSYLSWLLVILDLLRQPVLGRPADILTKSPVNNRKSVCRKTKAGQPGFVVTFRPPDMPMSCPAFNKGMTKSGLKKQCADLSLSLDNTKRCEMCCTQIVTGQVVKTLAGKISLF